MPITAEAHTPELALFVIPVSQICELYFFTLKTYLSVMAYL